MNKSRSESDGSKKNTILIFLFLTSSFFHVLTKQKLDGRFKIILLVPFFFIGCSLKHLQCPTPHNDINVCNKSQFFTIELINRSESLYTSHLHMQPVFLSVSQIVYHNFNLCCQLLLLLSDYIIFNTGSFHNPQSLDHGKWNIFKHRGLHFVHLNINSSNRLLPKN